MACSGNPPYVMEVTVPSRYIIYKKRQKFEFYSPRNEKQRQAEWQLSTSNHGRFRPRTYFIFAQPASDLLRFMTTKSQVFLYKNPITSSEYEESASCRVCGLG